MLAIPRYEIKHFSAGAIPSLGVNYGSSLVSGLTTAVLFAIRGTHGTVYPNYGTNFSSMPNISNDGGGGDIPIHGVTRYGLWRVYKESGAAGDNNRMIWSGISGDTTLPLSNFTIMAKIRRPAGNPLTNSPAFTIRNHQGDTQCCDFYVPAADGTAYFDFGGQGAGHRVSAAGLTFGEDIWAFTAGANGQEIWQNGFLRARGSQNPTRVSTSSVNDRVEIYASIFPTAEPDLIEWDFLYIWNRQLAASEIQSISLSPFSIFHRPTSIGSIYVPNVPEVVVTPDDPDTVVGTNNNLHDLLNSIVPSQQDGPELVFDNRNNSLYLNASLGPLDTSPKKTVIYDFDTKAVTTGDWDYAISSYGEYTSDYYGSRNNSLATIRHWSGYKKEGSQFGTQKIEFTAACPRPGQDFYFAYLKLQLKALPRVSGVLPTLRVEFALDGSSRFETKYVDLTSDFFADRGVGEGVLVRAVTIPIYRTARFLTIRLSTVNNNASINNGMELYLMELYGRDGQEGKDKGKKIEGTRLDGDVVLE